MSARRKKRANSRTGCLLWIAAFIMLLVLFFIKFDDIKTAVEKTGFLDALNHAISNVRQPSEKPSLPVQSSPQTKAPPQETLPSVTPEAPISEVPPSKEPSQEFPLPSSGVVSPSGVQDQKKVRSAILFFVRIDENGGISIQKVKRSLPVSDSPIQDTLVQLIQGPTESEIRTNLITLIPSGTLVRGLSIRGSTAIVDLSEAFAYNHYGKEGYLAQIQQIVFTLTEFTQVADVQFLIEGKKRTFLTEGIALDKSWMRSSF